MRAIIWNTPSLPIPGTSYFHVKKFMSGFMGHGFELAEVNDPTLLVHVRSDDLVYISNHGFDHGDMSTAIKEFELLSKMNCVFILWHFHDHMQDDVSRLMPDRFVFTGENHTWSHVTYDIYRKHDRFIPVKFLSSIQPGQVGQTPRNPSYDAQFVGAPYQPALMEKLTSNFAILGKYTPPFVSENDRLLTFLYSRCSLGFHSPENIEKRLVTERVAEGLALGCAVVSDNPAVNDFTDGCAEYASCYEEFSQFLEKARLDPIWLKRKQEDGYKFAMTKGTYTHLASEFLRKFASCDLI